MLRFTKLPAVPSDSLIVVTGATSGIGRCVAAYFSDVNQRTDSTKSFHVIGTTRNPDAVRDRLPGVEYLKLDLSAPETIDAFAAEVLSRGVPAVLISNAGESQSGPLEELPREALERLFQVNVISHVSLTQKFLPAMRGSGVWADYYGRFNAGEFPVGLPIQLCGF